MKEFINQWETELSTGERELETEEEMEARIAKEEDDEDWAHDRWIDNQN